jgi:hypothetical protein
LRHAKMWAVMGWSTEFFQENRHNALCFSSLDDYSLGRVSKSHQEAKTPIRRYRIGFPSYHRWDTFLKRIAPGIEATKLLVVPKQP